MAQEVLSALIVKHMSSMGTSVKASPNNPIQRADVFYSTLSLLGLGDFETLEYLYI